ncbi:microfibril-associated glycoprotein 4-like [Poecilia formosa]|uniref:Microfibril-associated glycoprotein 4-like n=1 Tax=Poecilia formosa TaxID=48698 RepID=A0A087XER9_POEFO|nr:PREDICTED: microfibril-associated glycoprotein 4-like [Poecilia formosa]XP_016536840.1 PREDICTED: microfibril-associated glycoprotein 4-like [Poecilia formosa]
MKALLIYLGFLLLSSSVQSGKAALPEDCSEIQRQSPQASSGVYEIQPAGGNARFKVYCEIRPDGGWIVFQRRSGPVVSFAEKWDSYKDGFGSLAHDHWLGLERVHLLTIDKHKKWTLRVDLWDHEGDTAYAEYSDFRIGKESTAFKLHVGRYSGNAGNAILGTYPDIDQNGFDFSTIDRDNDGCSPCIYDDIINEECAFTEGGGWWYSSCGSASLNGKWRSTGDHIGWASGLHWLTWKPLAPYSAKATRMMIKTN